MSDTAEMDERYRAYMRGHTDAIAQVNAGLADGHIAARLQAATNAAEVTRANGIDQMSINELQGEVKRLRETVRLVTAERDESTSEVRRLNSTIRSLRAKIEQFRAEIERFRAERAEVDAIKPIAGASFVLHLDALDSRGTVGPFPSVAAAREWATRQGYQESSYWTERVEQQ